MLLQHCRLGHPSFGVIKLLFPSLYNKLDMESLHYNVFKSFSFSNKMNGCPFYLIYIDVLGSSNIPNLSSVSC